jgi:AraC-like DNA-binding protein/mannose-6-phosphate isomerase-like protein (cupin superfamily)
MSRTRHSFLFAQNGRRIAEMAGASWEFVHGYAIRQHSHREDQLLFASEGVMTVETNEGVWVVPPMRAVWIPAETAHGVSMSGRVSMRTLYFQPKLCSTLPRRCLVTNISSLLRELILHACELRTLRRRVAPERHVIELILDQLRLVDSVPVQLPQPHDSRARKLANLLRANPHEPRPLETLSMECGASKRTMQRLFADECGMSFSRWRQRARLIHGMQRLAEGQSVTNAALDAGYSTTSAFISMFRKQLGTTPTRYLGPADRHQL